MDEVFEEEWGWVGDRVYFLSLRESGFNRFLQRADGCPGGEGA